MKKYSTAVGNNLKREGSTEIQVSKLHIEKIYVFHQLIWNWYVLFCFSVFSCTIEDVSKEADSSDGKIECL